MSFKNRKKPEKNAPSKGGEKKSATRKNPSKSGGVKGTARRADARKTDAQKGVARKPEARRGVASSARGRTGERKPREGGEGRKPAGEGRSGESRRFARPGAVKTSTRPGVNERFAAKSGMTNAERPDPKTRSLRSNPRFAKDESSNGAREHVAPKSAGRRISKERFVANSEPRRGGAGDAERAAKTEKRFAARAERNPERAGKSEGRFAQRGERRPERSAGKSEGRAERFAPRGERKPERAGKSEGRAERFAPRGESKPERSAGKSEGRAERFTPRGERRPERSAGKSEGRAERFAPRGERKPAGERFAAKGERKPAGERFAAKGEGRASVKRFAGKSEGQKPARSAGVTRGAEPRSGARFAAKPEARGEGGNRPLRKVEGRRGVGERAARKTKPRESDGDSFETQSASTDSSAKPTHSRPFRPRPSMPLSILRAEKPVERKRPDMSEEPHPGHYLLTCRQGSEQDLVDELVLAGIVDPPPRILSPSLVLAPKVPKLEKRPVELTFARQGFPIVQSVQAHDLDEISHRVSRSLKGQLEKAKEYALHVWVPDSEHGNPLAAMAIELEAKVTAQLAESLPDAKRVEDAVLRRQGSMLFAQVCLIDPERAVAGVTYSNAALSLARGGRTRVRVTGHFPSRAARKLEEAFAWLNLEPGAGELCVDLGAAPGGWTFVLAERRARVIAVDPAQMRPEILAKKGVSHVQQSAFDYKPEQEVDWLFCDMAWRPLEAAALLAKWGRNRWARLMVANIKLPMTKKAEIVERVKHILETEGDWANIRVKQLYHDRDEVTLSAHVR